MKNVTTFSTSGASYKTHDAGLRAYMETVFKYMSIALAITGLVAYIISGIPSLVDLIYGNSVIAFVVTLAPLFYVFYFSAKIWSMSPEKARNNLWIYSAIMGVSLTSLFLAYTGASIVRTFFVTSAMFSGMALYGNTTKKDLTGMGSFMIMGLIGIIVASIINIFLKSAGMEFAISILGVIIFTGLTAYDVQKIKDTYSYVGVNSNVVEKVAIIGALNLYMDFINLFIQLLRFFGERKN